MQYWLGTVMVDTKPFNADEMDRSSDASIIAKPLIGAAPSKEGTGEGEDDITISGQLMPYHRGGLDVLELLHEMRRNLVRFPVLRGDGWRPGWYSILKINENHRELSRDGVGYVVNYRLDLTRVEPDLGAGTDQISALLDLFKILDG